MHGLDLYDYGFRHYDPIVPMFTQQDPMAEKYYHLSPYVYCGGNPVNAIDLNGDTITANNENAQRNICYSLSKDESDYVQFNSNGVLDNNKLALYHDSSLFLRILQTLSKSEINYRFIVSDKTHDGRKFTEENGKMFRGITEFPGAMNGSSPDNSVWIITSSLASTEMQVRNTVHEGYGHAYVYEITRDINAASHTYKTGTRMEWFPEYNANYPVSVRIPTNTRLEEQILKVTNEAVKNYINYWK